MANYDECSHIATIGYLRDFISGLDLRDRDGNVVTLNANGKSDSYCPKYDDVSNGIYIPMSSHDNDSPHTDNDGLYIIDSQDYANNQLVLQGDVFVEYTNFKSITLSTLSDYVSACGGDVTLSTTVLFKRYSKSLNSQTCGKQTSFDDDVNDNTISVSVGTNIGSVETKNGVLTLTVPKNAYDENWNSNERKIKVTAHVDFRGVRYTSNEIEIRQPGLEGDYTYLASSGNVKYNNFIFNDLGCNDDELSGTGHYTTYDTYYWQDSCGAVYSNKVTYKNLNDATEIVRKNVGKYCNSQSSGDRTLSLEWGGSAHTYVQSACTCCGCDDFKFSGNTEFYFENTIAKNLYYIAGSCISSISASSQYDWLTVTADTVQNRITFYPSSNDGPERETIVTVSYSANNSECTNKKTFKVYQINGCTCQLGLNASSVTWDAGAADAREIHISGNISCIDKDSISMSSNTSPSHYSLYVINGEGNVLPTLKIQPNGGNNGTDAIEETITISYKCNGTSHSTTFDATHNGTGCGCGNLTIEI